MRKLALDSVKKEFRSTSSDMGAAAQNTEHIQGRLNVFWIKLLGTHAFAWEP